MVRKDWPENYLDWVALTGQVAPTILESWPNQDSKGADGRFNVITVRFTPLGLKMMKKLRELFQHPQEIHRQVTVNGERIDLRNRSNFDLMRAGLEQVEAVAESYLTQLRNKPNMRTRKRLKCELQRVILLRGPELRRDLYGSICLRIGAQLPSDFWHIPPENLPSMCVYGEEKEACA